MKYERLLPQQHVPCNNYSNNETSLIVLFSHFRFAFCFIKLCEFSFNRKYNFELQRQNLENKVLYSHCATDWSNQSRKQLWFGETQINIFISFLNSFITERT